MINKKTLTSLAKIIFLLPLLHPIKSESQQHHKYINLLPRDILFGIIPKNKNSTVNNPYKSIKKFNQMDNKEPSKHEYFMESYKDTLLKLKRELIKAKSNILYKNIPLENINIINNTIAIFDKWATTKSKNKKVDIIKLLYASVRLENLFRLLQRQNRHKNYLIRSDNLWDGSRVDIPCDLYKLYPDAIADAFIIPMIDIGGDTKENDILAKILNSPLKCPAKEFYDNNKNIKPTLLLYANVLDYLNGEDLKKWFKENKKENKKETEKKQNIKTSDKKTNKFNIELEIKKLKNNPSKNNILMQAVLEHIFYGEVRKNEISEILKTLINYEKIAVNETTNKPPIYDGSDRSMIDQLNFHNQGWIKGSSKFNIPCAGLIKKSIFANKSAIYSQDSINHFLDRHNCDLSTYDLPKTVKNYISAVEGLHIETIGRGRGQQTNYRLNRFYSSKLSIQLFPKTLAASPLVVNDRAPYETWSYLNLDNRKYYEDLRSNYFLAKEDLFKHYVKTFNMNEDEALIATNKAMWVLVDEGYWGEPPRAGLRYKILEEKDNNNLISYINSSDNLALLEQSELKMKSYNGGWLAYFHPDPLIMLTVDKPEILKALIGRKNNFNSDEVHAINNNSTQNNPNTSINARNSINKTALHAAIQENNLKSVKILIEAGADISATVSGSLIHNMRTVGMYAANNADIELIKYLKSNGVSYDGIDSQSVDIIGYLMGFGDLEANPHVNEYNFESYISNLAPEMFTSKGNRLSPSFDCKNSKQYSEIMICKNTYLALLDRYLSKVYSTTKKNTLDIDKLKKSQIAWIKNTRNCTNEDCLIKYYKKRILEISE